MPTIWLLPTRGRPHLCQQVLDACEETHMTSPGVVYVDGTVNEYRKLRPPPNWTIHFEKEWRNLTGACQWALSMYPDATRYGWLADDTLPRTKHWDIRLEEAAGDWQLAYCYDGGYIDWQAAKEGRSLSGALCWGAKAIQAVGWWPLPGTVQAGHDVAWTEIMRGLGYHRFLPDVYVEHFNWRTGKRSQDATDEHPPHIAADERTLTEWIEAGGARRAQLDILEARGADGTLTPQQTRDLRAERKQIERAAISARYRSGKLPAARLEKLLQELEGE